MGHRLPEPGQPVLEQVVGGAPLEALHRRLVPQGAGDDDDGDVQVPLLHQPQGLQGVELGEVVIGQDQVGGGVEEDEESGSVCTRSSNGSKPARRSSWRIKPGVVRAVFEQEHTERSRGDHGPTPCFIRRIAAPRLPSGRM